MGDLRRLIVFDLDGTLVDSRRDLADAANALILECGGQPLPEEAIGRMVGEGARVLVERALTAAGLPVDASSLPRFLHLYDERLLNTTIPYAGIPQAIDRLAKHATIAVLTNKPLAPSQRILRAVGLADRIAKTIGGDGPFPKKPDPAGLIHLMEALGAAPATTVMVGDSWIDFRTARDAGTAVCLARYGFGYEGVDVEQLRGDEALADEPSELPSLLTNLLDIS